MTTAIRFTIYVVTIALMVASRAEAQDPPGEVALTTSLQKVVRPLLQKHCHKCHADERVEADIDLSVFATTNDAHEQVDVWLKIREVLDTRQMPPRDAKQPTDEDLGKLLSWTRGFLMREAAANAGDPGPVVLRRLSNSEYNYTVRDLTGVDSLNPTREFPIDGAAGEGFINTGYAQTMSPSLVDKYLEAAKEVAAHAVLLPDGIEFSRHTTRRDHTNEKLAQIQSFYREFAAGDQVATVSLPGVRFNIKQEGLLRIERYLAALLEERDALSTGAKTVSSVAAERNLNLRYLKTLRRALNNPSETSEKGPLGELRKLWKSAGEGDAARLGAEIDRWRKVLWKFNPIGQFGKQGGPQSWMESVSPVVARDTIRLELPTAKQGDKVSFFLAVSDLGDSNVRNFAVWERPRIEFKTKAGETARPPIPLKHLGATVQGTKNAIASEARRTAEYLNAVSKLHASQQSTEEYAEENGMNANLLDAWAKLAELKLKTKREINGLLKAKVTQVQGHKAINGWGALSTPSLLTNQSNEPVSFLTLTVPPRSVVVHPSPSQESVVAWQSPLDATIRIEGLAADADNKCGNGATWRIELLSTSGRAVLANGSIDNGRQQSFRTQAPIRVQKDDVVSLLINARDNLHSCDTTHIEFKIFEIGGQNRLWNLATDAVDQVLQSNPLPDSYGNKGIWHFCATESPSKPKQQIVPGSTLASWRTATVGSRPDKEMQQLALAVQSAITSATPEALSEADRNMRRRLLDWTGPLDWLALGMEHEFQGKADGKSDFGIAPLQFGKYEDRMTPDPDNLCLQAPHVLEVSIPSVLAQGAEFVATGSLHAETGEEGSVQFQALTKRPTRLSISPSRPFVAAEASEAARRLESSLDEFRNLFPAALCYARIVPVDEVVTLTLFFREDHQLQRLMLDDKQIAELDRLWDELLYVNREPIALTVAYEQIVEFATQDRPDLVKSLAPLRKQIDDRADAFRKRLVATEPAHLAAVVEFADRAWRRALTENERANVRDFFRQLRDDGLAHEDAIRLTLARVLTSPSFLYRRERPAAGQDAAPVSSVELASRLSYFLWSSTPDTRLRRAADAGELNAIEDLKRESERMLDDPRTRRLAVQFACQWLHLRDFDQNDDKNEELYPEFAALRGDMYEETVRFFEDMFRNDGSILDLLDANHTFLNGPLAKHYGIAGVDGPQWRRVDGIRAKQRGGILTMATLLASQSGASRTSPILRGNWVSETLLGERLPRPPPNVPLLPEAVPKGLTAREMIQEHSTAPDCAICHDRIDPLGFALEQFDAIGRLRPKPTDTKTELLDGAILEGADGLRSYLVNDRRDDVVQQFCRKLLGFALGREVQLSDEVLIHEIMAKLKAKQFRFSVAVEAIVTSRQFRDIRGLANATE